MTTFAELRTLVGDRTKRPDLTTLTDGAIRTAVLRAHHVDFFPRDQREAELVYTPPVNVLFADIPTLSQQTGVTRIRALKTVYGLDTFSHAPVERMTFRESDDFYDSDGYHRTSIYTLVGDTLRVVPAAPTGLLKVFYYQNPDVSVATFSSWIADAYPDDVAAWAAQSVLTRTGFRELAARLDEEEIKPFKERLVASCLLGEVN